jgi:hypothetical protein
MEIEDPPSVVPCTDNNRQEPNVAMPCMVTVDPILVNDRIDIDEPITPMLHTDTCAPTRVNIRSENVEPNVYEYAVETLLAMRVNDLIESVEDPIVAFTTLTFWNEPICAQPTIERSPLILV